MDRVLLLKPLKFVGYIALSTLYLLSIIYWFTDFQIKDWQSALVVLIYIEIFQILIQPLFAFIARIIGPIGVLLIGLFGYPAIFFLALTAAPGIENVSFWGSVLAAWIYALVIVVTQWVFLAQSDDFFIKETLRTIDKKSVKRSDKPGFVFMQLDGVSSELLDWQLLTGNLPNLRAMLADNYQIQRWKTQLPSTTPASQAGILLGNNDDIPAFRWYDRKLQRLVVANQFKDAALIEKRLSNGKGLLAAGGVSVGNLFSGDAKENVMVMSKISERSREVKAEYVRYFSSLLGFMRAVVMSVGEIIKELRQARQQKKRNIQPRIERELSYVILRAGTNVLLRDIQTRIVLQKMFSGVNTVYVDYLDYDEIAHHAGIARPEALDALAGLDRVIGVLHKATMMSPRPYHLVIVSDHGQSQGPTFKQLNGGVSLEEYIGQLLNTDSIAAGTDMVEAKSQTRSIPFLRRKSAQASNDNAKQSEIVVTGSGNVGNIWFKRYLKRATDKQLEQDFPGLLNSLLSTRGIGFVIVNSAEGPICLSKNGTVRLKTGKVTGQDPLTKYGPVRLKDLLRPASMVDAPDIQVFSDVNPQTGEVYAFEELVGNHGGIGGWQANAILLHPRDLKISKKYYEDGTIYDSTTIHKILVSWLVQAGHRNK
jgi:uncharacterized membrane protein YvlD (DUF360 family)